MAYSIEQLKNVVNRGGGLALSNLFRVVLPGQEQARNLDLLCKSTNMPGRSMLTNERLIGINKHTVAYGYEKPNVSMTFLVLNDPFVRSFFEQWMNLVVDNTTYQIGYYMDYTRNINIQQLKKKTTPESLAQNKTSPAAVNATASGSKSDIDINYDIVYNCLLEDAYPVTMTGPQYSNDLDGLVEITVDFVYKNWRETNSTTSGGLFDLTKIQQENILRNSAAPRVKGGGG